MVTTYEAHCVLATSNDLGECCRWDEVREELSWVDVNRGTFFRSRAQDATLTIVATYELGGFLGATAPYRRRERGWIVARRNTIERLGLDGSLEELFVPATPHPELVRMNDGACDPKGRFLVGSMAFDERSAIGNLYCVSSSACATLLDGVTISNGLGWSADARRMYYVDSGPARIDQFDVDDEGGLHGRRTLVGFQSELDGVPDGLCVDAEGAIWVAMWDGGEVRRYSPDATLLATVPLPVQRPTSCAIGGANGTTLFITTARTGLSHEQLAAQPLAGAIFSADVGVRGQALNAYDADVVDEGRARSS